VLVVAVVVVVSGIGVVVVRAGGRPHGSGDPVVVDVVLVVVVVLLVVVVVAAEQPLLVRLQALAATLHVHRQTPAHGVVSPGGVVVVEVVVVVVVVALVCGEQSSPIRMIAQRSQTPGSRQRIRADPQTTARSTSTAPGSTSAYWYDSSPGRTRTRQTVTPETTASETVPASTPPDTMPKRPRVASVGTTPRMPERATNCSSAAGDADGSTHGSPRPTTENGGRSWPVEFSTSNRVASRATSSAAPPSSVTRRPRHSATTADISFQVAAESLRTFSPGWTFLGIVA
jgi:hypothetical protein